MKTTGLWAVYRLRSANNSNNFNYVNSNGSNSNNNANNSNGVVLGSSSDGEKEPVTLPCQGKYALRCVRADAACMVWVAGDPIFHAW